MVACKECKGFCCTHLVVPIDAPVDEDDYQDIFWYLYHEKCSVYIGYDDVWYLQVDVPCRKLGKDGTCIIHEKKPPMCKEYGVHDCEMNVKERKVHFRTPEEFSVFLGSRS